MKNYSFWYARALSRPKTAISINTFVGTSDILWAHYDMFVGYFMNSLQLLIMTWHDSQTTDKTPTSRKKSKYTSELGKIYHFHIPKLILNLSILLLVFQIFCWYDMNFWSVYMYRQGIMGWGQLPPPPPRPRISQAHLMSRLKY